MQAQSSILFLLLTTLVLFNTYGQNKKSRDRETIKSICGCYEVSFNSSETFQYSKDTAYRPSPIKHDTALEWIELIEDEKNKIVMQHFLIVGKPDKPHIIKYWREDWLFQNTSFYMYNGDQNWRFLQLPKQKVKGQWTQKVYQVDDSPRYEGSATWVYLDGKSYWDNKTEAPLPRREYTKRNDYNLTIRNNRIEITPYGWLHDQDNKKAIRKEGMKDFILAEEKGYNIYKRVVDSRCISAQAWWKENAMLWKHVRSRWEKIFDRKQDLSLHVKVKGKHLYQHLFPLRPNTESSQPDKIMQIIDLFVKK